MTSDETVLIWLRFLATGSLTEEQQRELVQAMESDGHIRQLIVADSEIDGLLRALSASDQDTERFVAAVDDSLSSA